VILLIQKYNFGASREDSYYLLLAVAAVLVVAGGLLFSTSGPTGLLTGIPPSVSITSPPNGIKINDSVSGALIFPEKSTHEKIILEIIAPFNLRETFNIVEGDEVKIELL